MQNIYDLKCHGRWVVNCKAKKKERPEKFSGCLENLRILMPFNDIPLAYFHLDLFSGTPRIFCFQGRGREGSKFHTL